MYQNNYEEISVSPVKSSVQTDDSFVKSPVKTAGPADLFTEINVKAGIPRSVLIGSTGRNTGKTDFACALINSLKKKYTVHAVKITTIYEGCTTCVRGTDGCGVCTSMKGRILLKEELRRDRVKDTSRMLNAGAVKVWWLRVRESAMQEAVEELKKLVPENGILVFESNSIRRVCEPDLFFMLGSLNVPDGEIKDSAKTVLEHVDRIISYNGKTFDFNPESVILKNGRCVFPNQAAAVILAGGASSRMGTDKRFLDIEGIPLIEHVYRQLNGSFEKVFLSIADKPVPGLPPENQISDKYPGSGPMGGVVSVLEKSEYRINFITACDIPWIPVSLVQKMLRAAEKHDIVVPVSRDGHLETLFAVYTKHTLPLMKELLENGERRIRMLYSRLDTHYVEIPSWIDLKNLNTREDYYAYMAG